MKSSDSGVTWSARYRPTARQVRRLPPEQFAEDRSQSDEMAVFMSPGMDRQKRESKGPRPEMGRPGAPMLYSRLNNSRTGFEPQRNLMARTFGLDGGGTIAADSAGDVYGGMAKPLELRSGEAGRQS